MFTIWGRWPEGLVKLKPHAAQFNSINLPHRWDAFRLCQCPTQHKWSFPSCLIRRPFFWFSEIQFALQIKNERGRWEKRNKRNDDKNGIRFNKKIHVDGRKRNETNRKRPRWMSLLFAPFWSTHDDFHKLCLFILSQFFFLSFEFLCNLIWCFRFCCSSNVTHLWLPNLSEFPQRLDELLLLFVSSQLGC